MGLHVGRGPCSGPKGGGQFLMSKVILHMESLLRPSLGGGVLGGRVGRKRSLSLVTPV